jgi:hypothetical protein
MSVFRVVVEVLGVGVFLVLHYAIIIVYSLGSDLREVAKGGYWSAIALGYIGMVVLAMFPRRVFGTVSPRRLLDTWLLAFPMAIGLSLVLIILKWPLRFPGWDAHGMGASGGEANSLFLPWLHLVIWIIIVRGWTSYRTANLS